MSAPILEVIDLCKHFGDTVALDGVSFQVLEGEMFGLLGPNGAGKTTLLSIAASVLGTSAGEVRVLGKKVQPKEQELRRQIGLVPQEIALYGQLSARENLRFFATLYGLTGAKLEHRIDEILDAVGLADRARDAVDSFSGGMKRRLNLGAGLVHQPRLLLLDEPTTGVDPQSRNHIFEEVRRINAAGVTVIYTTHYMREVQELCSRVGILDHGRMIACESLTGLLAQMGGLIRFRVPLVTDALRERLGRMADVRLIVAEDRPLELACKEVETTLLRLLAVLSELKIELLSLETEEPSLERVFLDLTGSAARE